MEESDHQPLDMEQPAFTPRSRGRRVSLILAAALMGCGAVLAYAEEPPSYLLHWGSTGSGPDQFRGAFGIAADAAGNVYVADDGADQPGAGSIKKFTSTGTYVVALHHGQAWFAADVAVGPSGEIYTVGGADSVVAVWDADGNLLRQWGTRNTFAGPGFYLAWGIALDDSENVYVTDKYQSSVSKFTSTGTFLWERDGLLDSPTGIWYRDGRIYIVDKFHYRIAIFDTNGSMVGTFGDGLNLGLPLDGAMDAAGNYILVDQFNHVVRKFAPDRTLLWTLGGVGRDPGKFTFPTGIALDGKGNIYVTQPGDGCCGGVDRVTKFGATSTGTKPNTWGEIKARYR